MGRGRICGRRVSGQVVIARKRIRRDRSRGRDVRDALGPRGKTAHDRRGAPKNGGGRAFEVLDTRRRAAAGLELRWGRRLRHGTRRVYTGHSCRLVRVETPDGGRAGRGDAGRWRRGGTLWRLPAAGEILIPVRCDICVDVDIAARRIRIAPPAGLLERNETKDRTRTPRTIRATERSERPERP